MNLKEPKKKKRVYHQLDRPFPIPLNKNDEWMTYTAHLSASGTCIAHPEEMAAVFCMGYFGKGSLSRGFPSFGKRRFGAPSLVRERQLKRRKQWLDDVKKLEAEPFSFKDNGQGELSFAEGEKNSQSGGIDVKEKESGENEEKSEILKDSGEIEAEDAEEKDTNLEKEAEDPKKEEKEVKSEENVLEEAGKKKAESTDEKNPEKDIDEVVLDSTEDEEVCEIVDNDNNSSKIDSESQGSQGDDICVLNDDDGPLTSNFIDELNLFDEKEKTEENPNEMLIIPDSDSDNEAYLKNIKPRIDTEGFPVTETLQLTFEETFFLMFGLGCLQVIDYDGNFLSIVDAWRHFNEQDKHFFTKYIVYHYFRSKGWVVKPGLKCSGDFVLYKKGPPSYHASYIVIIDVADADNLLRDDSKISRDLDWSNIQMLNRLSQTLGKEVLIAQVLWPSTVSQNSSPVPLEALSEFTVRELLIRRWDPCETVPLDDEDDDETDDDSS